MYNPSIVLGIMSNWQLYPCPPREVFIPERYKPLNFSDIEGYPHPFLIELKDQMPLFHAKECELVVKYVKSFCEVIEDFHICVEDIAMKFFMRSLQDDAREWYNSFPMQIISSWECFKRLFLSIFGDNNENYEQLLGSQNFPTSRDMVCAQM